MGVENMPTASKLYHKKTLRLERSVDQDRNVLEPVQIFAPFFLRPGDLAVLTYGPAKQHLALDTKQIRSWEVEGWATRKPKGATFFSGKAAGRKSPKLVTMP